MATSHPSTQSELTYPEAVERLLKLGLEGRKLKWNLESIRAMLERLGHPEQRYSAVHIAGTNGKGSVAAMVASILEQAGYRTGLYTSPHLRRINERIAINGAPIADDDFAAVFARIETLFGTLITEGTLPHNPSYFETLTAMALQHFADSGADAVILEAGLGGRLDATNAVNPAVCAVTSIDFDHERWLGHSIEAIAGEKAGILKPGAPVINAAEHPQAQAIIRNQATKLGVPVIEPDPVVPEKMTSREFGRYEFAVDYGGVATRISLRLPGRHQVRNALTAVAVARELAQQGWNIPAEAVCEGLRRVRWPGRLQLLRPYGESGPLLFLDGAHNPAAARQLAEFWQEHLATGERRRVHLIYGTLRDKAVEEIAELLFPPAASVILTEPHSPRAASVKTLSVLTQDFNPNIELVPAPVQALRRALRVARPEDVILVAGSLYLVGDCLSALEAEGLALQEETPEAAD